MHNGHGDDPLPFVDDHNQIVEYRYPRSLRTWSSFWMADFYTMGLRSQTYSRKPTIHASYWASPVEFIDELRLCCCSDSHAPKLLTSSNPAAKRRTTLDKIDWSYHLRHHKIRWMKVRPSIRLWRQVVFSATALASFDRKTSVISTVTKIPALVDHVPLISQEDLKAGAQVLSTPNLFYVPFMDSMDTSKRYLHNVTTWNQENES